MKIVSSRRFEGLLSKLDNAWKPRVIKLVEKIIQNPEIGKSMRFARQGTREIYLKPFRLSYSYSSSEQAIYLLDLYHKDEQ